MRAMHPARNTLPYLALSCVDNMAPAEGGTVGPSADTT